MGKPDADLPPVASEPRRHGPGVESPGFGATIPGMKTAPVEHVVRQKTRAEMAKTPELWKQYNELSRNMMLVNRAERGPMKDKPFAHKFNGEMWPEDADEYDSETWLQPGEYMIVPKDVALHFCGNLWLPINAEIKFTIIQRYGDWQYEGDRAKIGLGGFTPMVRVGAPPVPDLLVCETDGRSKPKGDWKSLYDLLLKGEELIKDISVSDADLAGATAEHWERVKA